jgi:uncharacterized protein (TIGR00369 family)
MTAAGEAPGLARTRALLTDPSGLAPIARLLGARLLSVDAGRATVEFAVREDFRNPGGAVQGGIVTAYADACMALAARTLFDRGEFFSTSSLTIDFLAPLAQGPVIGEGSVVRRGRSVIVLEASLRDREGVEYARAISVGTIRRRNTASLARQTSTRLLE